MSDTSNLMQVLGIRRRSSRRSTCLAEFFPKSAADADKQRFVLKHLTGGDVDRCAQIPSHRPLIESMAGDARDNGVVGIRRPVRSCRDARAESCHASVDETRNRRATRGSKRLLGAVAEYLAQAARTGRRSRIGHSRRSDTCERRVACVSVYADDPSDHARIPDLQQPRRVRIAQHFHRRTAVAACARSESVRAIERALARFRTAQARGSSPPQARSAILPCTVSASPRTSSRYRRRRMIS